MELAKAAHARFTYAPSSGKQRRMFWKMSIDLSYPLVPSMGHHDPLDGYITYSELRATAAANGEKPSWTDLSAEIADIAVICEGQDWTTDDPLGMGDLLCSSYKVAQLFVRGNFERQDLLEVLLDAGLQGLESYAERNALRLPAHYRLAFRELGLSIGLHAAERLQALVRQNADLFENRGSLEAQIETLMHYSPMADSIEMFWLEPKNRKSGTWTEHLNINMVMLATSLAPDAYLTV
jgi:hypothetical protein